MRAAIIIGLSLLVTANYAEARSQDKKAADLQSIMGLDGECERLIIADKDQTANCSGKLINITYKNGRSGFYFAMEGGALLTFSGMGSNQVKTGADRVVQPVDMVLFGYQQKTDQLTAVGQCDFENPYKGKARTRCSATSDMGALEVLFVSDGKPPEISYPRR